MVVLSLLSHIFDQVVKNFVWLPLFHSMVIWRYGGFERMHLHSGSIMGI